MNYLTHKRRLYPALASTFAYYFAATDLEDMFTKRDKTPQEEKEVHVLSAGIKGAQISLIFP